MVTEFDSILCDTNVSSTSRCVIIEIESHLFNFLSGINISIGGNDLYIKCRIVNVRDGNRSYFDEVEINKLWYVTSREITTKDCNEANFVIWWR